jgi:putative endonuclease
MHFVYIVRCVDDSLYTGYTTNLSRRLAEHNGEVEMKTGQKLGARYTRARRPVFLVYSQEFKTRSEAMKRESEIKRLSKAEKLRLLNEINQLDSEH